MALTATERSRRHADSIAAIDSDFDEAWSRINWDRRNHASESLLEFIRTYMIGPCGLLDTPPSEHMSEVINEMDNSLRQSTPT